MDTTFIEDPKVGETYRFCFPGDVVGIGRVMAVLDGQIFRDPDGDALSVDWFKTKPAGEHNVVAATAAGRVAHKYWYGNTFSTLQALDETEVDVVVPQDDDVVFRGACHFAFFFFVAAF